MYKYTNPQAVHTYNGFSVEEVMDFAAVACGESTEDPIDKATKKVRSKTRAHVQGSRHAQIHHIS